MSKRNCLCFFVIFIVLCLSDAAKKGNKLSCKDEKGHDVDWLYMYKLPKHFTSASNKVEKDNSGLGYLYVTSDSYDAWKYSNYKISDLQSIPARTFQPIFDDPKTLLLAYNDEFPNGTVVSSGGHTKGVVATDGETAIWFIHSVPKFPNIAAYEFPDSGAHYGQSFLCLTLDAQSLHKIGTQLIFNEPNFYHTRIPSKFAGKYPELEKAANRMKRGKKTGPTHNLVEFETLGGKDFVSFAKGSQFKMDLYEDWLAPYFDVNLLVETWRKGAGNMPSNCTKSERVYNVDHINVEPFQLSFSTTNDHSKWAVSQETGIKLWRYRIGGSDWICVGDINRQLHQMVRGGGTVCQKSSRVAGLYRSLIASFEPCPKKKKSN